MPEKGTIVRNRLKTRSGCTRCKQRKIKCDETSPHCTQCTRRGYDCPGYKRPLKWSSKYQVASCSNTQAAKTENQRNGISSLRGSTRKTRSLLPARPPLTKEAELVPASPSFLYQDFTDQVTATLLEEASDEPICAISTYVPDTSLDVPRTEVNQDESLMDPSIQLLPLSSLFEDDDARISRHYFSRVCHINSCFDSHQNLFRVEIGHMMSSCPLIYHCILSMSAAHLSAKPSEFAMSTAALAHKTKAISCLTDAIVKAGYETEYTADCSSSESMTEALLASILLGMTDGWHSPSQLGITHLHGARMLFKRWIGTAPDPTISRITSFIIGIMAYWEAIASFLIDQSVDETSYLDQLHDQAQTTPIYPNPWSGICTPVFIYLSKAGTLSRQRSLLRHLSIAGSNTYIRHELHASLAAQAREVEAAVLNYKIPSLDQIADTDDVLTPPSHLQQSAQIYRLSTLLELYRSFPELLHDTNRVDSPHIAEKILALATAILSIIQTIPRSSGVTCLLTIPLLIAGSTLQSVRRKAHTPTVNSIEPNNESSWDSLATEILQLPSQETIRLYWRDLVRERLGELYSYVGMVLICRASEIVEKVWARADVRDVLSESGDGDFVQWTEVMVEEKLETILG